LKMEFQNLAMIHYTPNTFLFQSKEGGFFDFYIFVTNNKEENRRRLREKIHALCGKRKIFRKFRTSVYIWGKICYNEGTAFFPYGFRKILFGIEGIIDDKTGTERTIDFRLYQRKY
ncbi:MAG: hypothetical protein ACI4V1_01130, partial [Eubacteriales bacterium]